MKITNDFNHDEKIKKRVQRLAKMFVEARQSKMLPLEAAALMGQIKLHNLISLERGFFLKKMTLFQLWNFADRLGIDMQITLKS